MQKGEAGMVNSSQPANRIPVQFNHVGFTVARHILRGEERERLTRFFEDVFGFVERKQPAEKGEMLVMMAGGVEQFLILFGHDEPTRANPPLDHFGLTVGSLDELKELLSRAKAFQAKYGTIKIVDYAVIERHDVTPHKLHKFYTMFGAPAPLEVQYFEML
jgi:glyoxalase/bleomycin resistance protein/dioxygenase superfamily protein